MFWINLFYYFGKALSCIRGSCVLQSGGKEQPAGKQPVLCILDPLAFVFVFLTVAAGPRSHVKGINQSILR